MRWRYRETVLALCTLAFFATMGARLAIGPVVPAITDEFGVSNGVIGTALTGMWLAYALTQFPSGVLGDRFGERPVVLVAVGGTGVAGVLAAAAPAFPLFVACLVLLGAVAGLHYSVATTLLTRTYDGIGTAIGVHTAGGPAAGLVAPAVAAWVVVRYGWRPAVGAVAAIAVPVFILFAWRVRPTTPRRPDEPMRDRFELGPVLELLGRPPIVFTVGLAVLGAFVWQATASFLPTFLVEYRGRSTTTAGLAFSAYFVVQGLVKVGIGAVSDRIGRDFAAGLCMSCAAAGFGLLVAVPGTLGAVAAIGLLGVGLSWAAAVEPRFFDNLSDAERGAGFGLVRTVYLVLGATGPVVVGLAADAVGWGTAFWLLAALPTVVCLGLAANWLLDLGY